MARQSKTTKSLCKCGCGEHPAGPKSSFRPGHDAKFYGRVKKLQAGTLSMADLKKEIKPYAVPTYTAAAKGK